MAEQNGPSSDTEFLLAAIRAAALRAKVCAAELETVGVGLKSGVLDYDKALQWLHDLRLIDHVLLQPSVPMVTSKRHG